MVNMIELDHRFVVVGGLIVACLFYQVPFFTIATVILCGGAIYARNRYKKGDRVSLGLTGFRIVRQTRSVGRLRTLKTPPNTIRSTTSQASTPRNQTWGRNLSFGISPVSPCVYGSPYRGQLTSRMLQSKLSQGSPKTSPVLGLKGVSSESPRYFQQQTTGSLGAKPDMSANKPDTSYNDICQAKYVGVGVYPTVHLEPSLPLLLSNFNSTMTKNRVTVKVAPREKQPNQKPRLESLQNTSESDMVIDALKNSRKRSLNDDVNEAIQKKQRVQGKSTPQSFLASPARFLPNGIDHRFNSHLCDESMLILPPHFAGELNVTPKPVNIQLSKKRNITGRDSIESSYSSSKKMAEKTLQRLKSKRKPEQDCVDMPENKISRSKMSPTIPISPSYDDIEYLNLQTGATKVLTGAHVEDKILSNPTTPDIKNSSRSHTSLDLKSHSSPLLGSKGSSSMYIPSYIPTLDDYLQDKILNDQRLQKMLNAIAGKDSPSEECDTGTTLQIIDMKEPSKMSLIKTSESQLLTSLVVSASSTAPMFPFGKAVVVTDSVAPSLAKSNSLPSEGSTENVSQLKPTSLTSANLVLPVLPQALSTSMFTPSLSLSAANPSIANATSSSLSLVSNMTIPTTSILPVVTTTPMMSSAPAVNNPFNKTLVMSTPAVVQCQLSTNPLITPISSSPSPFSFGQTTSGTTSAMNSFTTTVPAVPFPTTSSLNLSFGNPVSTSLNTSTVSAVTSPLFSFGSTSSTPMPAFSVGAGSNTLGLNAPSTLPTFSMASSATTVPSIFNVPSSTPATGTASAGFQFGQFASQAASPLNDNVMKENVTSGMTLASTIPSSTMSTFGVMTANSTVTTTSSAPSLFNAVALKPLMANNTTSNSSFQQGNNNTNPSNQSASGGFAFGLSQNESTMKTTGGLFTTSDASKVVNPFVTNQSLAFGLLSNSQASSFGTSNAGTSIGGGNSDGSSAMSTGTPFAFGNGSTAFATKSFMGGQLGTSDGPLPSNSAGFGANHAGLATNNTGFGVNNTAFAAKNSSFSAIAGFGSNNAGSGSDKPSNAGFGTSTAIPAGFGTSTAIPAGFGTSTAIPAGFGSSTAVSAGFGTNTGIGAGFGSSTGGNASFGTSTAGNVGFGTGTANSVSFGTSTPATANSAGFGTGTAGNTGFGTGTAIGAGFGTGTAGNTGFGTGTAISAGFGTGTAGNTGFGIGTAGNTGFGTGTAGNTGFGTGTAGNTGFGTGIASNTSFGTGNTGNSGFGASNVGNSSFGVSNAGNTGFGTSNSGIAGFGASNSGNAGFGGNNAGNAGFPGSHASTEFGATSVNGSLPPSYSSSAGGIFGGNTKPTSASGFAFGNSATPTTTVFGSSSAVSQNATSTSFQFNGSSNTNFFGSSSNNNENNNTSLGSPFSFKGQPTQSTSNQGFNFNPGAQPSFNFGTAATAPSASSMFSVGTGSQAPRFGKTSSRIRNNR